MTPQTLDKTTNHTLGRTTTVSCTPERTLQRDGQDHEIMVTVPMINGEPFEVAENDWDIHIHGTNATASVQNRRGVLTSVGKIHTNAEFAEGGVLLYCKSSRVPFGPGPLTVEMTIYAPHEKFDDKIQVLKTLEGIIEDIIIV